MNTETVNTIVSDTFLTDIQARLLLGNKLFKVMETGTVVTARKGQNLYNVKMDKEEVRRTQFEDCGLR